MKPTLTAEQREERTFARGQEAAARLIRALAVPDRIIQIGVAKVLIDAEKRASHVVAQEGLDAYELERWTGNEPEARVPVNLHQWHSGPFAIDAEPAVTLPATMAT